METINEGSTAYLTASFKDKDGTLDAPSAVSYRIDCLTNDQEVRDDTAADAGETVEITLTAADNAIIDSDRQTERRLVTVTATYGEDDALMEEYEYNLKNLRKNS